ncbi:MAG: DMT family transporter [Chloroflexi bacterium]|nr:DMT family transporter [Chloroflexota bacterium]
MTIGPLALGLGELGALLSALSWALTSIVIRPLSGRMAAVTLNAARSTITAALLLTLLPLAGDPTRVPFFAYLLLFGSLVVGLGLADSFYFESIRLVGVSRALPLASAYPLFATLLAILFLGEALTPLMALGIAAVVLGVYLVAQTGRLVSPLDVLRGASARGTALALLAALMWGASTVMMRPALEHMDVFLANVLRMSGASVLMWLFAWRRGRLPARKALTGRVLGGLLLAGLLTVVTTLSFLTGVQLAGAAKASTLSSTSPLFAVPISALLLREKLTLRVALGTLLSVAGIWMLVSGG